MVWKQQKRVISAVSAPPHYLLSSPFQTTTYTSPMSLLCTRCTPVLPHISILPSIAFEFMLFKTHQEVFWSFLDKGQTRHAADVEKWRLLQPWDIQQGCSYTGNCRAVIFLFLISSFPIFFFLTPETLFRGILFCKNLVSWAVFLSWANFCYIHMMRLFIRSLTSTIHFTDYDCSLHTMDSVGRGNIIQSEGSRNNLSYVQGKTR